MDPRTFHTVAVELAAGKSPAHLRSATSRAYYAVFNSAAELLRPSVPISKGAAGHDEVQNCLSASGDSEIAAVGADLRDLHSRRIRADYRMDAIDAENPRTVNATQIESGEMLQVLDAAFGSQRAVQLRAAIQQYWRDVLRKPL